MMALTARDSESVRLARVLHWQTASDDPICTTVARRHHCTVTALYMIQVIIMQLELERPGSLEAEPPSA